MSKKRERIALDSWNPMKSAPLDGTIVEGHLLEVFDDCTINEIVRMRYVRTNHRIMKNHWVQSDWSFCNPVAWRPI